MEPRHVLEHLPQVALLLRQACATGAASICSMPPYLRRPCVSHHSVICNEVSLIQMESRPFPRLATVYSPTHGHSALPKAAKQHFWANGLCGYFLSQATIRTSYLLGTEKPDLRTVVPTYTGVNAQSTPNAWASLHHSLLMFSEPSR